MFKILKGVQVQGNAPGMAYGGGIYNMSCSLGSSGEPTKVSLSIVSESGVYSPPTPNVTLGGLTNITIADNVGSVTIHRLYPYKYTTNSSAESKTLSVSFVDQGAALNKIFVGLTARHAPIDGIDTKAEAEIFNFDVRCLECNTLWPHFVQMNGDVTRTLLKADLGFGCSGVGIGNATINGGFIIIGEEKFTDGNCEVPAVEYSFNDLCVALDNMGIAHNLTLYNRSTFYTAAYTGTLKEVLNSWAADFGFSFTIDPFNPTLTIVSDDLERPVGLAAVNNAINLGFYKGSTGLLRSRSQTLSLEGTYAQKPIVKNIKPARGFSRQQTSYKEMNAYPVHIREAVDYHAHLGRSDAQLMVSMALAKYQKQARLIWLSDQAGKAWVGAKTGPFPALGFIPHQDGYITDADTKKHLLDLFGGAAGGSSAFKHPVWQNPNNYMVFVGVYNPADQGQVEANDAELADFYGKYFKYVGQAFDDNANNGAGEFIGPNKIVNPPPSIRQCPFTGWPGQPQHKYYDYASQISTLPNGEFYKDRSYPFKNILKHNLGVFHAEGFPGGAVVNTEANAQGDYILPVEDNVWGTDPEHVEQAFTNQWVQIPTGGNWDATAQSVTDLEHFLPIYAKFNSDRVMGSYLRDILPNFDLDFMAGSNQTKGYFPGIAIIPVIEKCLATNLANNKVERVLEVTTGGTGFGVPGGVNNVKVYDNLRRKVLKYHNTAASRTKSCIIYCEEDIVSDLCRCDPIQDPVPKFHSTIADWVKLSHLGNDVTLVFPVTSAYKSFWKADMVWRGTYPKEINIKGLPPTPNELGNVMGTRVVDHDVTAAMDAQPTAAGFDQQFAVNGQAATMDLTVYANNIDKMTQSNSSPAETISVKVDGISYDTLWPFINPSSGLTSFNITVDGEGMSTDLAFSSHPPIPPKRDIWMQKFNAMSINQRHTSNTPFVGGHDLPYEPTN
jgi:hypothetical protein